MTSPNVAPICKLCRCQGLHQSRSMKDKPVGMGKQMDLETICLKQKWGPNPYKSCTKTTWGRGEVPVQEMSQLFLLRFLWWKIPCISGMLRKITSCPDRKLRVADYTTFWCSQNAIQLDRLPPFFPRHGTGQVAGGVEEPKKNLPAMLLCAKILSWSCQRGQHSNPSTLSLTYCKALVLLTGQ